MSLIFEDMTRRTLAVFDLPLRTSVSSIFYCQDMRTGSQLRHNDSIFVVLDNIQICFHAKVTLNVTIGSQDRVTVNVLSLFCPHIDEPIPDSPFTFRFEFRWWTINIKKICIDHFANMSNPCHEACLMQFSQLIIHLLDNTIIRRMMKTIDIAHSRHTAVYILGGKIPHSPYTIILLVVAFTLRIHLQKRNMTLSTIDVPFLLWPQTSLPYINIGFTIVLKSLNITFGGIGVMDRNLWRIPNKAFLPWSHKYG